MSGLAGRPGPANESNAVLFLCFCLPLSLSLSLTDSFFSYSLSHALASFLSKAGSVLQTKLNLAHLDC